MKGTQSSKDRTRSLHEYLFHFVKSKQYFYDYKKILVKPKVHASIKNGKVISSATTCHIDPTRYTFRTIFHVVEKYVDSENNRCL